MWSSTGSLGTARFAHTATLLANGRVLVAGGNPALTSAELYDPATGLWNSTGSMGIGRAYHTATLLTSGQLLVAGGLSSLNYAELYDPASGTWSITGSLGTGRGHHTATLLADGQVLVAAGLSGLSSVGSAELYDPASGSWSDTGSLGTRRFDHKATLLANGQVLVTGGYVGGATTSCELYDPGIVTATTVSGRGTIEGQGDQATFSIRATQGVDRPTGSISFSDLVAGITMSKARVRTLSLTNNSADLGRTATLGDGSKVTFDVSVTDNGDGSTDTFSISLSNGYSAGGPLNSGDIRIQ